MYLHQKVITAICVFFSLLFTLVNPPATYASAVDHPCLNKAQTGDYNCDDTITTSDLTALKDDMLQSIARLSPFFEWIRMGMFGENATTPSPHPTGATPSPHPTRNVTETGIKVLVIDINPMLATEQKTIREMYGYVDPLAIFQRVRDDLQPYIPITIAATERYNSFPPIIGTTSSEVERKVRSCLQRVSGDNQDCDSSWTLDYKAFFDELNICEKVNSGEFDEVWIGTYPYNGSGEDDMVGPNPYNVNGKTVVHTACQKNVPILAADYNRTGTHGNYNMDGSVASTLHSLSHRVERTMAKVFGSWNSSSYSDSYPGTSVHSWDHFALAPKRIIDSTRVYGCGNTHYPPNAVIDYEYSEDAQAKSYCASFIQDYPATPVVSNATFVTCSMWGCDEYGYMKWWYAQLPDIDGTDATGRLMNWYEYIFDPEKTIDVDERLNPGGGQFFTISQQSDYIPIDHVEHYYRD